MQNLNDLSLFYRHAKQFAKSGGGDSSASTYSPKDFRALFISDIHLGAKDSKAAQLNLFLKCYSADAIYLVGDIIDGWKMKGGIFWKRSFNHLIRRILKIAKQGTPIYYITGNHDEFLRKYANNSFDNIYLHNRFTHTTVDGKRLLVIHGDQFEGVTHCSRLLKVIGDRGYELLMLLNRQFNRMRAKYGYGYWSFSAYLKSHLSRAQRYIADYEHAVAYGAKKQGFDGVVCGHIHHPAHKEIEGVSYLNTGDWVESCTAIAEEHDGTLRLIHWLDDPRSKVAQEDRKSKHAQKRKAAHAKAHSPA